MRDTERDRRERRRRPPRRGLARGAAWTVAGLVIALAPGAARALDLADVTPSSLLGAGEIELRMFLSVYTQTASFDDGRQRRDEPRSTYTTGTLSVTAGTGGAWNPGVDFTLRSVRNDAFPADTRSRTSLTAVRPRVQFAPFAGLPTLALETGLRLPVAHELEGTSRRPYLDWADPVWTARAYWDLPLRRAWSLWVEAGSDVRGDPGDGVTQITTPLQVLANWLPHPRWTVYVPLGIAPDWLGDAAGSYWSQVGLGLKTRPTDRIELELLGTTLPAGRNAGAGSSVAVGLRWAP